MNLLKNGMQFKSSIAAAKFLGYTDVSHSNQNLARLSHFCEYKRNDDKSILITNVFDNPIPFKNNDFVYEINDIIETKNSKIKILAKFRDFDSPNHKCKFYTCQCIKDNYVFNIRESRIVSMNVGCPICGGHKLIDGYTSLYDEHPELLSYIVDKHDAKFVTSGSTKKILCKCPICKNKKTVSVNNFVKFGFSCPICDDGISYPNKFVRNVLMQLKIEFDSEKIFKWSNGKIYDIFIPSVSLIIENHGEQHYKENTFFKKTLKQETENDIFKKNNAINNGIDKYITLDCSKSNKDYIKNSIINSELPILLKFNEDDVNWELCDLYAKTSIISDVCNAWEKNKNITDISKQFGLALGTVRGLLKTGSENGLCSYDNHIFTYENQKRQKDKCSKPIYCESLDIYFYSSRDCEKYFKNKYPKFNGKYLYNYINKNKLYYNMKFIYISKEQYNSIKKKSLSDFSVHVIGDLYDEKFVKEEK